MTTRILSELNRTDLSSQAADAIKTAISYYGNDPWGFNETSTAISVVSGTYRYSLPADFITELAVAYDDSGYRYPLFKISIGTWDARFTTSYQSEPQDYCLFADSILFQPTPYDSYSAVLTYVHSLPELSDSASNPWTIECEEMIRMRATADLLENVIRGQDAAQQAIICRARESEIYRRLRSKRERQQSSHIKRRGYL